MMMVMVMGVFLRTVMVVVVVIMISGVMCIGDDGDGGGSI